jgi:hypothetical protein
MFYIVIDPVAPWRYLYDGPTPRSAGSPWDRTALTMGLYAETDLGSPIWDLSDVQELSAERCPVALEHDFNNSKFFSVKYCVSCR